MYKKFTLRIGIILSLIILGACDSEDKTIDYDLSGTWQNDVVKAGSHSRFIIKDGGSDIEVLYCGRESVNLETESNIVRYEDGSLHYYQIISDSEIQLVGDDGNTYTLNKISLDTSFSNGTFTVYSAGIVDKEYDIEVCFNKSIGGYSSGNTTSPEITGTTEIVKFSSHFQPFISSIVLTSETLVVGQYEIGGKLWEQKVLVTIDTPEFRDRFGQEAHPSTGSLWIDAHNEEQIVGGGIVELSEHFDNQVIEFTFDISY
ncbi:MAG: hypothetical protein HRT54_08805 [Colwellia sp.]|nr:hypothetical protein [Colwellia sp.]